MKHLQCGSTSPFIAPPPPNDVAAGDVIELKLTVVYHRSASAPAASELADAATCTLARLRESGATGDWRVDEKTGLVVDNWDGLVEGIARELLHL